MPTRFIGKNLRKKVVKPLKNSVKHRNYTIPVINEYTRTETTEIELPKEEERLKAVQKKENKKQKKNKEMVNENKLSQLETIVGTATTANVKVEKSDKGLYERTENSTILITEDNKMLLND